MMNEYLLLMVTLWPMIGGFLVYLAGNCQPKARFNLATIVALIEFLMMTYLLSVVLNQGSIYLDIPNFCGLAFSLKLDGFRVTYGLIAAFMWWMTTGYTKEYLAHYQNHVRYLFFTLVTAGATIGVFLSNDLYTTFIYFEIMSFTSYVMVVHDQKEATMDAGLVYIVVAVLGGLTMLMGLFILYQCIGTLNIDMLHEAVSASNESTWIWISGVLMLVGFGAKAGLYPLHIWLPKAHPVAPAPASALLSGILTKAGVFGMIVISMQIFSEDMYWAFMMLCLGTITMVLGAILAVFSNNLKRTLACSSMSQIGFITIGISMSIFLGHHNALAVRGTILHMVNHSLIKLLLFMIAGVVYTNTHQLDLNKVQGFGRKKWGLMVLFLVGALGISGIPLFNGYISKTLLHESIVETIELVHGTSYMMLFEAAEIIFLFAGGLTLAYMMKLFICLFVEKNQDEELQKEYDARKSIMSKESWFYLSLSAIPLLMIGLFANQVADSIADFTQTFMHGHSPEHTIHYFSLVNLKGSMISIMIGVLVYIFVIRGVLSKKDGNARVYLNKWPSWLDLDVLLYRPLLKYVLPFIFCFITRIIASLSDWTVSILNLTVLRRKKVLQSNQDDFKPGALIPQYQPHPRWTEVENSLSYGLMLFGLGVCTCLVYMLSIFF